MTRACSRAILASASIKATWMASRYAKCSTTPIQDLIHPATLAATMTLYSDFIAGRRIWESRTLRKSKVFLMCPGHIRSSNVR